MATRSYIGLQNPNGTVTYVYCHNDGYLAGVGCRLFERFNADNRGELAEFLFLGDRSTVHDGGSYKEWRNEDRPARTCPSVDEYLDMFQNSSCDYAYLLDVDGEWKFARSSDVAFQPLAAALVANGNYGYRLNLDTVAQECNCATDLVELDHQRKAGQKESRRPPPTRTQRKKRYTPCR